MASPAPDVPHESPYRRILFCTDFSPNADEAFAHAIAAASRRPDATLHLLHVIPEPDAQFWKTYVYEVEGVDAKARHDVDEKIEEAYASRVPAALDFQVHVAIGRDYVAILDFARRERIDLIVIGRQGHTAFGRFLSGGVTEKVARKAPCPVLVVPPASEHTAEA